MANRNRPPSVPSARSTTFLKTLKIDWKDLDAKDHIPYKWFEHDVDVEDECYEITNLCEERGTQAKCEIRVSGSQATLYYGGSNKKYNESLGYTYWYYTGDIS